MAAPSTTIAIGSESVGPEDLASVFASALRLTGALVTDLSPQTEHDDSLLIEALIEVQRGRLALEELLEAGISAQWAA